MSSINKYEPQIQWLGVIPYREALDLQEQRANEVRADHSKATIFGLEHNTVITLGIRGREQEDIFSRMEDLTSEGIEVERVRRGGQATLHSPGQLVIYPILPLRHWGLSTRALMKAMEIATCRLLKEKGILSYRGEKEPGVYTSKGKIAFFG
ncbi:MAG: hypothetical protein KDD35_10945, partial [Bdellovibrionales bacterium]|nr:hypothetical protein [Bdellovibrionales bacterium]